jgi:hypothetical protein
MNNSTHSKGLIGELEFATYLIKKGYSVLTPLDHNCSYDLVWDNNGKFVRIQVKYLTPHNGILRVELDRPKRKTKTYQERNVDAMGVYDSVNDKFYLIPLSGIQSKSQLWLRVERPKNGQKININFAEKYLI